MEKDTKEMEIGEKIKFIREKVLKQERNEFAKRIEVSYQTLGNWETGKRPVTSKNLNIICRVYKINPQWFETGEGEIFLKTAENKYLEDLCNEYELGSLERQVLEKYLSFSPELRTVISNWMLESFDFTEDLIQASRNEKRRKELEEDIAKGQAAQEELKKIEAAEHSALVKDTLSAAG